MGEVMYTVGYCSAHNWNSGCPICRSRDAVPTVKRSVSVSELCVCGCVVARGLETRFFAVSPHLYRTVP